MRQETELVLCHLLPFRKERKTEEEERKVLRDAIAKSQQMSVARVWPFAAPFFHLLEGALFFSLYGNRVLSQPKGRPFSNGHSI